MKHHPFAIGSTLSGMLLPLTTWAQQSPSIPTPPAPPYPGWGMPYYGHMWGGGMGYGGFGWGHLLMWLLLIAGVVAVYMLARNAGWGRRDSHRDDPAHSALQILNERYARGDIEKAEYEEKKAALLSGGRR